LRRLFGQHGIQIFHAKHLVGNFNAHLRDAIFLFADEAFFAGDKQNEGVLKALITEEAIAIEPKGVNVIMVPNCLHLIMASNKDWVVPASLSARRFFVLEVPDTVTGNRPYFAAIWQQMECGGYAAMLHDLLSYDLTGFEVREVPITAALQRQKKLTLPVPKAWWLDVLHRGYIWESKLGLEETFSEWSAVVNTELLYKSYTEFGRRNHDRHPMDREAFGKFMGKMGGVHTRRRGLLFGEHVENHPEHGRRPAVVVEKALTYGYFLGSLEVARKAFTEATKLSVDWHDGEPAEGSAGECPF
jgi:Family of unknown function (DUF5906)